MIPSISSLPPWVAIAILFPGGAWTFSIFSEARDWTNAAAGRAKKYSHNLVSEMICDEICSGRPIHWIDGGMALDPSGLIPMLSKRGGPQTNSGSYVGAGLSQHIRWWI